MVSTDNRAVTSIGYIQLHEAANGLKTLHVRHTRNSFPLLVGRPVAQPLELDFPHHLAILLLGIIQRKCNYNIKEIPVSP